MKNIIKAIIIAIVLIVNFQKMNAQSYSGKDQFRVTIGMNIVEDSFSTQRSVFNNSQNWNLVSYPSYFGISTFIGERFILEAAYTINQYEKGSLIDGKIITDKMDYLALDATVKFNLKSTESENAFLTNLDPFIGVGLGYTEIATDGHATFNYGLGTYIWLNEFSDWFNGSSKHVSAIGFVIQTQGKSSFEQQKFGNQIQHSFGLVYRF